MALYDIRELASAALFEHLKTVTNFVSAERKFETWDAAACANRPALRWLENTETRERYPAGGVGQLNTITIKIMALIYWDAPQGPDVVPAQAMNVLLASLDEKMRPNKLTERLDLGLYPQVQDCWIEGEVTKDPGDVDGTGLIAVPINVLLLP